MTFQDLVVICECMSPQLLVVREVEVQGFADQILLNRKPVSLLKGKSKLLALLKSTRTEI